MVNRFLTGVVLTSAAASDVIQKCVMNTWNLDHSFFFLMLLFMLVISRGWYKVSIVIDVATVHLHLKVPDCKFFNFCNVWLYPSYLYDMLLAILAVMSSKLRRLGRK